MSLVAVSVDVPGWIIFDTETNTAVRFYVEDDEAQTGSVLRTDRHGHADGFEVDERGTFLGDGFVVGDDLGDAIITSSLPTLEVAS